MTARRHSRRTLARFALGTASALALGLPAAAGNFTFRIG
jgi:ABC-type nitrate/sulfonate/bicarbonate transport system permease component